MAAKLKPRTIGRYIVADPAVCHGQPTFRGTRILVADVLEQVRASIAWESIAVEWRERVSKRGYRRGRSARQPGVPGSRWPVRRRRIRAAAPASVIVLVAVN
jgi:hypothetical protein